jgi:exodeoxyribonuclease VII small subunit
MAMEKQLSYDEALKRVETIVSQLEQSEAISVDAYKQLADEATRLLDYCRKEIEKLAMDVKS